MEKRSKRIICGLMIVLAGTGLFMPGFANSGDNDDIRDVFIWVREGHNAGLTTVRGFRKYEHIGEVRRYMHIAVVGGKTYALRWDDHNGTDIQRKYDGIFGRNDRCYINIHRVGYFSDMNCDGFMNVINIQQKKLNDHISRKIFKKGREPWKWHKQQREHINDLYMKYIRAVNDSIVTGKEQPPLDDHAAD
jgi:hypothetical protein